MAERWMRKWRLMLAVLLTLGLPTASWAGVPVTGNLQFYENSVGQGNTLGLSGPVAGQVLDLRYDASSADGITELGDPDGGGTRAGIFDFDIVIITTGNVGLDAFICMATNCGPPTLTTTSLRVQGGDQVNGEEGLQSLGLLTISGTNGTVRVQGGPPGGYTPFSFVRHEFAEFVLATVTPIPEPASFLLLGMGLGALAFLRRRTS